MRVVSDDKLYAKVLAGQRMMVVGSMNGSINSSSSLIEAGVMLDSPRQVETVRRFVLDLVDQSTEVDETFVELARSKFRPQRGGPGFRRSRPSAGARKNGMTRRGSWVRIPHGPLKYLRVH